MSSFSTPSGAARSGSGGRLSAAAGSSIRKGGSSYASHPANDYVIPQGSGNNRTEFLARDRDFSIDNLPVEFSHLFPTLPTNKSANVPTGTNYPDVSTWRHKSNVRLRDLPIPRRIWKKAHPAWLLWYQLLGATGGDLVDRMPPVIGDKEQPEARYKRDTLNLSMEMQRWRERLLILAGSPDQAGDASKKAIDTIKGLYLVSTGDFDERLLRQTSWKLSGPQDNRRVIQWRPEELGHPVEGRSNYRGTAYNAPSPKDLPPYLRKVVQAAGFAIPTLDGWLSGQVFNGPGIKVKFSNNSQRKAYNSGKLQKRAIKNASNRRDSPQDSEDYDADDLSGGDDDLYRDPDAEFGESRSRRAKPRRSTRVQRARGTIESPEAVDGQHKDAEETDDEPPQDEDLWYIYMQDLTGWSREFLSTKASFRLQGINFHYPFCSSCKFHHATSQHTLCYQLQEELSALNRMSKATHKRKRNVVHDSSSNEDLPRKARKTGEESEQSPYQTGFSHRTLIDADDRAIFGPDPANDSKRSAKTRRVLAPKSIKARAVRGVASRPLEPMEDYAVVDPDGTRQFVALPTKRIYIDARQEDADADSDVDWYDVVDTSEDRPAYVSTYDPDHGYKDWGEWWVMQHRRWLSGQPLIT